MKHKEFYCCLVPRLLPGDRYEVGRTYKMPKNAAVTEQGFSSFGSPVEAIWRSQFEISSDEVLFAQVEQSGSVWHRPEEYSTEVRSSRIKIISIIAPEEMVRIAARWMEEDIKRWTRSSGSTTTISKAMSASIVKTRRESAVLSHGGYARITSLGSNSWVVGCGGNDRILCEGAASVAASTGDGNTIVTEKDSMVLSCGNQTKICAKGGSNLLVSCGRKDQIVSEGICNHIFSCGEGAKVVTKGVMTRLCSIGSHARIDCMEMCNVDSYGPEAMIVGGEWMRVDSRGENAVIILTGDKSYFKAKAGSRVIATGWASDGQDGNRVPFTLTELVGGERIKADTWYAYENGQFSEQ